MQQHIDMQGAAWWARMAAEWAAIAACFAFAVQWPNVLVWWVCALVIGSRQHALAVIGHWSVHGLLPGSRWLQWLCFAPAGVDPRKYRAHHFTHHRAIGQRGTDVEAGIAWRFEARWRRPRRFDLVLDALGLHADEMLCILRTLASPAAAAVYMAFMAALFLAVGWAALLWPIASGTGVMLCQRLRARTEHDHINAPGKTIATPRPSLLARLSYLPHCTWLHAEHHANPTIAVWDFPAHFRRT